MVSRVEGVIHTSEGELNKRPPRGGSYFDSCLKFGKRP